MGRHEQIDEKTSTNKCYTWHATGNYLEKLWLMWSYRALPFLSISTFMFVLVFRFSFFFPLHFFHSFFSNSKIISESIFIFPFIFSNSKLISESIYTQYVPFLVVHFDSKILNAKCTNRNKHSVSAQNKASYNQLNLIHSLLYVHVQCTCKSHVVYAFSWPGPTH